MSGEIPDVLTVATLAILTYMRSLDLYAKEIEELKNTSSSPQSPTRLFSNNPWTFTRCKGYKVVGGFDSDGLEVYDLHRRFARYIKEGVGVMR